jgi:hypothetical protein
VHCLHIQTIKRRELFGKIHGDQAVHLAKRRDFAATSNL